MTLQEIYSEVIWNLNKETRGTAPTNANLISSTKLWINNRIKAICKTHNFYFMETTNPDNFTLNGTQSYSIDSISPDIKDVLNLILVDGTQISRPIKWQGAEVESKYSQTDTLGEPTNYWVWGNKFWFYPIPDKVYVIRVKSYNWLLDLVNNVDTNEITKRYPQLLINGATADGFNWLQEDASLWEQKFQIGLGEIIRENNRKVNQDYTAKIRLRLK